MAAVEPSHLLDLLSKYGVAYTPVDGWETRGNSLFDPEGVMVHHTASTNTYLTTIINGTATVPGPLSQWFIEDTPTKRSWLVANERCNHAGRGDHNQLDRLRDDQPVLSPTNDNSIVGNRYFYGLELEGINTADFPTDGYIYTQATRVAAAYCEAHGWDPMTRIYGHKEWTTRKIDPAFNMDQFRKDVKALMSSDHRHLITTDSGPHAWGDASWQWYVENGFTSVPETRVRETLREDIAWAVQRLWAKFIVPLQNRVTALENNGGGDWDEARVASLETRLSAVEDKLDAASDALA